MVPAIYKRHNAWNALILAIASAAMLLPRLLMMMLPESFHWWRLRLACYHFLKLVFSCLLLVMSFPYAVNTLQRFHHPLLPFEHILWPCCIVIFLIAPPAIVVFGLVPYVRPSGIAMSYVHVKPGVVSIRLVRRITRKNAPDLERELIEVIRRCAGDRDAGHPPIANTIQIVTPNDALWSRLAVGGSLSTSILATLPAGTRIDAVQKGMTWIDRVLFRPFLIGFTRWERLETAAERRAYLKTLTLRGVVLTFPQY